MEGEEYDEQTKSDLNLSSINMSDADFNQSNPLIETSDCFIMDRWIILLLKLI